MMHDDVGAIDARPVRRYSPHPALGSDPTFPVQPGIKTANALAYRSRLAPQPPGLASRR